ncbi:alkylphosphonate utilization operon protein PhnA [Celeribacter indicus]|nr:alkylphosphonate utilization operon protein PhnA [Celeribacter indicus]
MPLQGRSSGPVHRSSRSVCARLSPDAKRDLHLRTGRCRESPNRAVPDTYGLPRSAQPGYAIAMTETLPPCPECGSEFTYAMDALLTCPECGHEWSAAEEGEAEQVRDAVGNLLSDGDTVTVIKDLKVKGSSSVVKVGTKVRGIRLVAGDHDIDCKVPGIGQMGLKSQFVKKVSD